ncbi:hypothetical protein AB0M83_26965 [Amycolatopsis sp. NPDC051106]|uniref:hypothetical protein n=1 Tax=unclassified Amycolatopsis TaxID=2618356 RepID=UPI00343E3BED
MIRLELADGSVRETRVDVPRGNCRAPLSDAEPEAKLKDCVRYSGLASPLWNRNGAAGL